MLLSEIYDFLNAISPFELQESWDNSGINVGDMDADIERIYISLDVDFETLENIEPNSLLITHHPLIFKSLKSLRSDSYPSNLLFSMIKKGISLIGMHTNFDKTHLNRHLCENILEFSPVYEDGFLIKFPVEKSFETLLQTIKEKLGIPNPTYLKCKEHIKNGAIICGSGASMVEGCGCDLFLSGDIKYHDYVAAKSLGISIIDITHYHSEKHFAPLLAQNLKNLPLQAIITDFKSPYGN